MLKKEGVFLARWALKGIMGRPALPLLRSEGRSPPYLWRGPPWDLMHLRPDVWVAMGFQGFQDCTSRLDFGTSRLDFLDFLLSQGRFRVMFSLKSVQQLHFCQKY